MNFRAISGVFKIHKKVIKCSNRANTFQFEAEQSTQNIATKKSCISSALLNFQSHFC